MRRRAGSGLVRNELRILLCAIDLHAGGESRFHGYDLARKVGGEDATVPSQSTMYRALRRLEKRGALASEWESLEEAAAEGREGRPRRYYTLTPSGSALAASELRQLNLRWHQGAFEPVTD